MERTNKSRASLFALAGILALGFQSYACSWSKGYFYQVSNLRGTIVGVNRGDLRQMSRWLRQRVKQGDVGLTLYEYQWPARLDDLKVVKRIKADSNGSFDFGALSRGHYALVIQTPWRGYDIYDVEIIEPRRELSFVTIDISPNLPDCTGGHELIVHQK